MGTSISGQSPSIPGPPEPGAVAAAGRRAQPSSRAGSRAIWPGSRRAAAAGLACVFVAAAAVSAVLLLRGGGGQPAAAATTRYGQIPSWLPQPKVQVGRLARASSAHPWLAIEGDTVSVRLARGRVLATTVGPVVPEEGRFPVPATSPCRFTITFTAATGSVPLRAGAFTILDELSHLHDPRVTLAGGGPIPRAVAPGHTVTLSVSDILPTGNGQLRWAPEGSKPIVSWDFDVEID